MKPVLITMMIHAVCEHDVYMFNVQEPSVANYNHFMAKKMKLFLVIKKVGNTDKMSAASYGNTKQSNQIRNDL